MAASGFLGLAIVANLALHYSGSYPGWALLGAAIAALCGAAVALLSRIFRRIPPPSTQEAAIRRIKSRVSLSLAANASPEFPIRIEKHLQRSITNPRTLTVEAFLQDILDGDAVLIALLGPLGAGKSVIASRLILRICDHWESDPPDHPLPLYIRGRDFGGSRNLRGTAATSMEELFDIDPSVTSGWLMSTRAILIVDGIEETPSGQRETLLRQLKEWTTNGRKCLLTCRPDVETEWLDQLKFDCSATVLQLSNSFLAQLLQMYPAPTQLTYLVEQDSEGNLIDWRRPLFTSMLAMHHSDTPNQDERDGLAALDLGDQSLMSKDNSAARRAYELAFREPGSYVRGSALVRLGYLSAAQGDTEGAHSALQQAARLRLAANPEIQPAVSRQVSGDGRKVLACLLPGVGYDLPRIAALSAQSPSAVLSVVNELVDEGLLVESVALDETVYTVIARRGAAPGQ